MSPIISYLLPLIVYLVTLPCRFSYTFYLYKERLLHNLYLLFPIRCIYFILITGSALASSLVLSLLFTLTWPPLAVFFSPLPSFYLLLSPSPSVTVTTFGGSLVSEATGLTDSTGSFSPPCSTEQYIAQRGASLDRRWFVALTDYLSRLCVMRSSHA